VSRRRSAQTPAVPPAPAPAPALSVRLLALILAVAAALPFGVALDGAFVYDDVRQIVENPLIQDPARLGEALTSDVWAFSGLREGAASNYWRPVFVLWLAALEGTFGLASTLGWHAASLLLHVAVTLLAFAFALRCGLGAAASFLAATIVAVHPTRAESVAWISGAPDLLAALLLLLGLLAVQSAPRSRRPGAAWGLALLAVAAALLAKEVAVLAPLLVGAYLLATDREGGRAAWSRAAGAFALFALPVAAYLIARRGVLGVDQVATTWSRGLGADLASAPRVLLFYLRQVFLPVEIGPSYPLRVAASGSLLGQILAPLAVVATIGAAGWYATRRDRIGRFGLVFFAATLAPALHVDALHPEQIVHDRYLYLPLLGMALAAASGLGRALGMRLDGPRRDRALVATALALAVPLGLGAASASRTWRSELALWNRGVATDPTSAFNHLQLAEARRAAGDLPGARAAIDRAAQLAPTEQVLMARADVALEEGRLAEAGSDLQRLHVRDPSDSRVAERLAIQLAREGRLDEAESVLRRGRAAAPERRCSLTTNLARILAAAGRPEEARRELESVRSLVATEATGNCRESLALLADLERRSGRPQDARRTLEQLLEVTAQLADPETRRLRERARLALESLPSD
jgi:tetratricopeptide (TPR) repeat protein